MASQLLTQSQEQQSNKVPEFVKERLNNKTMPDIVDSDLYLVIDIGTYLIKYTMFSVYDISRVYVLNTELKDSKDIIRDGIINQNLLKRDIQRKVDSLSELGSNVSILIIPPKTYVNSHTGPHMEYRDKPKEIKDLINREITSFSSGDALHDWAITSKEPDKDYLSVYMESTNYDIIIPLINVMIDLKINDYKIVSPIQSSIPLAGFGEEETVVVDIGHSSTSIVIVKGQNIVRTKVAQMGSKGINEKLNLTLSESVNIKHNSSINEYPGECLAVLEGIRKEVRDLVDDYEKTSLTTVSSILVLGGVANSDVENLFDLDSFRIPMNFLEMDIENVDLLPRETRNYIATSYGALMNDIYSVDYEAYETVDYSSPKDSKMIKLKKLAKWFSHNKQYAYTATATLLLSLGLLSAGSNFVIKEEKQFTTSLSDYESQLSTLQSEVTNQQSQYNTLLTSNSQSNQERHNIGDMLDYLTKITPPNLNIKNINLNGNSETGTLKVTSSDERLIATFITLLQDPESGIFGKVNIGKVEIVEVSGTKYYENHLFVEGMRF